MRTELFRARSHRVICDCGLFLLIMGGADDVVTVGHPLSPAQPICCVKRNRSRNQKNTQCKRAFCSKVNDPSIGFHRVRYTLPFISYLFVFQKKDFPIQN